MVKYGTKKGVHHAERFNTRFDYKNIIAFCNAHDCGEMCIRDRVMGHKISDVDSIGAAIGIYRAAKSLNKKAHIVVNNPTMSVRPIIENFRDNPDYDEDMFVDSDEAKEIVDNNTCLLYTSHPCHCACGYFDYRRNVSFCLSGSFFDRLFQRKASGCNQP